MSPTVLADIDELKRQMEAIIDRPICVEGFPGAGKSKLACAVGIWPARNVVRIDAFLQPQSPPADYVQSVNKGAIHDCIRSASPRVVIEGLMLRSLLDEQILRSATFVYVKRLSPKSGLWHDGLSLEAEPPTHPLYLENFKYHQSYTPHLTSHYVFERGS